MPCLMPTKPWVCCSFRGCRQQVWRQTGHPAAMQAVCLFGVDWEKGFTSVLRVAPSLAGLVRQLLPAGGG
jgi:hypothetical protein